MATDVRTRETSKEVGKESNQPVKRFRAGGISATIWANEAVRDDGTTGTFYTVSVERSYKDKEGAWHNVGTFRTNDLPRATIVMQKAYEWIALAE